MPTEPDEFDLSKYDKGLRDMGRPGLSNYKAGKAPKAPDEEPEPEATPEGPPRRFGAFERTLENLSNINPPESQMRGVGKAAAGIGTGIVSLEDYLGHKIAPGLTDLAESYIPQSVREGYQGLKEYADEPAKDFTEGATQFGMESVPYSMVGGGPVARGVEAGLARILPPSSKTVMKPLFVKGRKQFTKTLVHGPSKWAAPGGRVAGDVAAGATTGAVANREDPGAGAVAGGMAGPIPGAAAAALHHRGGSYLGSHALASVATWGLLHAFTSVGLPGEIAYSLVIPGVRWHSSPSGHWVHMKGGKIVDRLGRVFGSISPGFAGGAAGTATAAGAGSTLEAPYSEDER